MRAYDAGPGSVPTIVANATSSVSQWEALASSRRSVVKATSTPHSSSTNQHE